MNAALPAWNPWAASTHALELYRQRCLKEIEEMTCAGQAARVLGGLIDEDETLLDAGCGAGYYYHSFRDRGVPIEYHGLDYTPEMIALARDVLCPATGLDPSRFTLGAIEYLETSYDTVLCFNTLTNSPHYALGLERLLACARRRILIRESMGEELLVRYLPDRYLDEGKRHIRVYHNTYPIDEVERFIEEHGFEVTRIRDERSDDGVEMVVDVPTRWRILLGERRHG